MMHRVYLAGPMTGLPDFNYPAFNAEEKRIRALGYIVEVNGLPRLGALLSSSQLRQLARQLNEIANDADQGASGEHCYTAPPYGACPPCHSTKTPHTAA
ncbi:DUF4406 domain-containing protein [Pseudomonas aeruginosa]|nr:DUF4406 domain-containing protein [Pseudomonas aeruginosa]